MGDREKEKSSVKGEEWAWDKEERFKFGLQRKRAEERQRQRDAWDNTQV